MRRRVAFGYGGLGRLDSPSIAREVVSSPEIHYPARTVVDVRQSMMNTEQDRPVAARTRRSFLERCAGVGAAAVALPACRERTPAVDPAPPEPDRPASLSPGPSTAQRKWMDLRFGLFVHFGPMTFHTRYGQYDLAKFKPEQLDTDQWIRCAKAAGMRYVVLTAKHHDGFCLWPTKTTDYAVQSTPFRDDVVRAVAESARQHGLALGIYYSLWDMRESSHDKDEPAYVEFMIRQLEELLTGYGPVVELWFDGFWKKQQTGWTKEMDRTKGLTAAIRARDDAFIAAWRSEGAFRWQIDRLYQFVKRLQPDCVVMNNPTTEYPGVPLHPVDARAGEHAVHLVEDRAVWRFLGKDVYLPLQIETTLSKTKSGLPKRGHWHWRPGDHTIVPQEEVLGNLRLCEKLQANLLLNVGPMASGQLRPEDERLLSGLRG
jgi:alpha-L-fucosidase